MWKKMNMRRTGLKQESVKKQPILIAVYEERRKKMKFMFA